MCKVFPFLVCFLVISTLLGCSLLADASKSSLNEDSIQTETHKHFVEGVNRIVQNQYASAAAEFDKVLQLDFNDAHAHLGMAKSKKELRRYSEAIAHYEIAISLLSKEAQALVLMEIGHSQHLNGNFVQAVTILDQAIEAQFETSSIAYVFRAQAKHELSSYTEAVRDYSVYIQEHPDDVYVYYLRGLSLFELNCFELALIDIEEALLVYPASIYLSIGKMHEIVRSRLENNNVAPLTCAL